MLNHLLLSLILTGLFYFYNQRIGKVVATNDYVMVFLGAAIGLALIYRYMLPKGTALPSVTGFLGLEKPSNGPNGEQVVPCYSVPYKVISTQYGDQTLLAGYNENVTPYDVGASDQYEPPSRATIDDNCVKVDYVEENVV